MPDGATTTTAIPPSSSLALREQFATPEQQRETATVGMWIFLVTEVMLFGALFMAFTAYRIAHAQAFDLGSKDMDILLGSINTAVLISSSFTMALSVHAAQEGKTRLLAIFLVATILIGAAFLGIKFTEYYFHYQDHKAPGVWFETNAPDPRGFEMFFVFYFIMTCLHAVHMTVGIGILLTLLGMTLLGRFSREYHNPVVLAGLYWHFVDIVWVFLFAIFYLPGRHL
jgi:cytochrome c oxidase subunit 3